MKVDHKGLKLEKHWTGWSSSYFTTDPQDIGSYGPTHQRPLSGSSLPAVIGCRPACGIQRPSLDKSGVREVWYEMWLPVV